MMILYTIVIVMLPYYVLCKHHKKNHVEIVPYDVLAKNLREPENVCKGLFSGAIDCPVNETKEVSFNLSSTCYFSCSYNVVKDNLFPVRFKVHEISSQTSSSIFISVQQSHYLSAWTLPIIFPEHGDEQAFTSIEEILCPPLNQKKEIVSFRIDVSTLSKTDMRISLSIVPINLSKEVGGGVTVITSPVSPWIKLYQWEDKEDSVQVIADSVKGESVCAILSLQNAKCPVSIRKDSILSGNGRYQSFQEKGGMVARKEQFPDGVFIVVLPLPTDEGCAFTQAENKTSRTKSVRLQIWPHKTMDENYGTFLAFGLFICVLVLVITFTILTLNKRYLDPRNKLFSGISESDDDLLTNEENQGSGNILRTGFAFGGHVFASGQEQMAHASHGLPGGGPIPPASPFPIQNDARSRQDLGVREQLYALMEGNEAAEQSALGDIIIRDDSGFDGIRAYEGLQRPGILGPHPLPPVLMTQDNTPRYVYWWKIWSEHQEKEPSSHVSEVGFQNNLFVMAVFMALPFTEVVKSYLNAFTYEGAEDKCYYNSRCITTWGKLADFSRVFTNIGYLLCGCSFLLIVSKHSSLNWKLSVNQTLGVRRNYGLFKSLGYGLVIQGVMSALYHVCPNPVMLRFDMMFIYVNAVIVTIGVWSLRHGSVAKHVYSTVGMVGVSLLAVEARHLISDFWFWGVVAFIHGFLTLAISYMISTVGTFSFSPLAMFSMLRDLNPVYENLKAALREEDKALIGPWTITKAVVGITANAVILITGISLNLEAYIYILSVCIVNMALYLTHYAMAKRLHGEKGTLMAWVCIIISFLLWIPAVVFFLLHATDSQSTPSASRALNSDCLLLNVFDAHDLWHILSAFALFFSFVGFLTLDDELTRRNPQKIPVF